MSTSGYPRTISSVAVALLLGLYVLRLPPMNGRRAPIIMMTVLTLAVVATILGGATFSDSPAP